MCLHKCIAQTPASFCVQCAVVPVSLSSIVSPSLVLCLALAWCTRTRKKISVQVAKRVAPLEFCAAPMVKHSHPPHPDEACGSAQEVSAASQELLERTSTSYEPMSRVLSASLGQIQVSGCKASQ